MDGRTYWVCYGEPVKSPAIRKQRVIETGAICSVADKVRRDARFEGAAISGATPKSDRMRVLKHRATSEPVVLPAFVVPECVQVWRDWMTHVPKPRPRTPVDRPVRHVPIIRRPINAIAGPQTATPRGVY
jgi:hypothetical protein